jgi:prophage antirepressor-like protein
MTNTISNSGGAAAALVFESTTFDVVDQNGQQWLKASDLARALGYSRSDKITRLFDRNSAEFTGQMTAVVETPTLGLSGNLVTQTRIFSLRGAHLLAMFARTAIAALFRKWVLDILDHQTQPAAPYSVSPDQTLSAEQAATLRNMLDEACKTLAKDLQGVFMMQGWSKLKAHFKSDYRHIPAAQFTDAVSIVSRHVVQFSSTKALPTSDKPKFSLLQKRWLVYFDENGVERAMPIPVDAFVANWDQVIDRITSGEVSNEVMLKLADAACMRLHIVSTHEIHKGWGDEVARQIDSTLSHDELRKVLASATKELWSRTQDAKKLAPQRSKFVIQNALRSNPGAGQS